MQVRAKSLGFYDNGRKRAGQKFTLTDPKHFSERWMEALGEPTSAPAVEAPSAEAPTDEVDDLRAKYLAAFGKKPFAGWGPDKLKEKLSEKAA